MRPSKIINVSKKNKFDNNLVDFSIFPIFLSDKIHINTKIINYFTISSVYTKNFYYSLCYEVLQKMIIHK